VVLPDDPEAEALSSFQVPTEPPASDPDAGDMVHICFSAAWLPYVLGAVMQLFEQTTWETDDPDLLLLTQQRVDKLLYLMTQECQEMPTGMVAFFAGETAPDGYLICDGSPVSRTCYAALFSVIGTLFGEGDGSTTFNLPDLRARFPVGAGEGQDGLSTYDLADTGGEEAHQLTTQELASHNHADSGHAHTYFGTLPLIALTGEEPVAVGNPVPSSTGTGYASISNTGGDTAHENRPPYLALNAIIKY
jgi:microcystin-dependent protein